MNYLDYYPIISQVERNGKTYSFKKHKEGLLTIRVVSLECEFGTLRMLNLVCDEEMELYPDDINLEQAISELEKEYLFYKNGGKDPPMHEKEHYIDYNNRRKAYRDKHNDQHATNALHSMQ